MLLLTNLFSSAVPPSVFIDQMEVIAEPGEIVTVHCSANGTPRAQISWYKRSKEVIPDRRIALSSQGHLVINAVERGDQGFYMCLASNIAGKDSRNISIKVQGRLSCFHLFYLLFVQNHRSFSFLFHFFFTHCNFSNA